MFLSQVFSHADIRSVDIRSVDIRSADIRSVDIRSVDIRSVDIRSVDMGQLPLVCGVTGPLHGLDPSGHLAMHPEK